MIKTLTSKDNPKVRFAASLKESKYRKEYQSYLGESKKSMLMALEANVLVDVFTLEKLDLPDNINQYICTEEILKKVSTNVNPEVVFIAKMKEISPKKTDRILYLDDIQDPGNLGTIIRTALAFDFDAIYVSKNTVSLYNEKVVNSTKGAIYKMPVIVGDILPFPRTHQIIVSSLEENSINFRDVKLSKRFVLVLGNEAHGVKKEIKKLATDIVKIPVSGIDSLNVAIAGGILMAEYSK